MILQEIFNNTTPYTINWDGETIFVEANMYDGSDYELVVNVTTSDNISKVGYVSFSIDDSHDVNYGDKRNQQKAIQAISLTVDCLTEIIDVYGFNAITFTADLAHQNVYRSVIKRLSKKTNYAVFDTETRVSVMCISKTGEYPFTASTLNDGSLIITVFGTGTTAERDVFKVDSSKNLLIRNTTLAHQIKDASPETIEKIGKAIIAKSGSILRTDDDNREQIESVFGDIFEYKPASVILTNTIDEYSSEYNGVKFHASHKNMPDNTLTWLCWFEGVDHIDDIKAVDFNMIVGQFIKHHPFDAEYLVFDGHVSASHISGLKVFNRADVIEFGGRVYTNAVHEDVDQPIELYFNQSEFMVVHPIIGFRLAVAQIKDGVATLHVIGNGAHIREYGFPKFIKEYPSVLKELCLQIKKKYGRDTKFEVLSALGDESIDYFEDALNS